MGTRMMLKHSYSSLSLSLSKSAYTPIAVPPINSPSLNHRKSSAYVQQRRGIRCSLEPPDLTRLAQTARISLTPNQVEEFSPKIQQVVDWYGLLCYCIYLHCVSDYCYIFN
ncbi:hypothetical protein AgCh_025939 [Apium graveolens]